MSKKVIKVVVPDWPNKVKISEAQKPKYWMFHQRDKMPNKYKDLCHDKPLLINGKYYAFNKKTNERFIKNPTLAGSPRYWRLNGQDFYAVRIHPRQRAKVVTFYHKLFKKYIDEQIPKETLHNVLIEGIDIKIYEQYKKPIPDIRNMWIIGKIFEDCLTDDHIKDDSPEYIIGTGDTRYHWVKQARYRKLVFLIKFRNK